MNEQLTIFDIIREKYILDTSKPIKLIEMFAGYGSQALALKYLGVPFIHHKICEWAVPSIQAYKDLHFTNCKEDFTKGLTEDELNKILFEYGISVDYNKPMVFEQIKKRSYEWKKKVFNNIKITHNLVNIMSVKGKDLDFIDNKNETIILTYSFPCQDLSLAGKRKGMSVSQAEGESGTRSGLLWEVERILAERERENLPLPNVLLMENVPQVISQQNIEDFNKWQLRLEKLGYCNYHQLLNAKDYGIPQNRNRCFMISLLGEYNYNFPKTQKSKLIIKDLLEDEVDEKYFLSQKMLDYICANNDKWTGNNDKSIVNKKIASTINTGEGSKRCDASNYISDELDEEFDLKELVKTNKQLTNTFQKNDINDCEENDIIDGYNQTIIKSGEYPTLTTKTPASASKYILIKNATKQGYLKAQEGECVDISSRMETHRGTVQPQRSQTITTQGGVGVVVRGNYSPSGHNASRVIDPAGIAPAVMENHGTVTAIAITNDTDIKETKNYIQWKQKGFLDIDCRAYKEKSIAPTTTTTTKTKILLENLQIRKLTPKECFRLMGVRDEDYEKVKVNQSDSSLYHLAGDSIVVNVLMEIFRKLLGE